MKKTMTLLSALLLPLFATADDITFSDSHVEAVCLEHWDSDGNGKLSKEEAAAVISLSRYFSRDVTMTSFNELKYFTGLASISSSEFYSCKNLASIQLPPQVTSIGDNAFRSCLKLTAIDIPKTVKTIYNSAFNGCIRLATVTLHEGLETISDMAFTSCKSLQRIDIPASVTSISSSAFHDCKGVTAITVAEGNTVYDSREDCNAIVKSSTNTMVLGCQNSTFPATVTVIGTSAFQGCTNLQRINLPEGIKTISELAFSGCTGLLSVSLPSTLTTIDVCAFSYCSALTDVILPEGLKTIESSAFEYCLGLKSISIPSSVTTLSNNVFGECSSLVEVTVGFSTPLTIYSTTFSNRTNATLYVPAGSVQAFMDANYWKDFLYIEEAWLLGDVNHDTRINIFDVTVTINYILGKNPESFHFKEADANQDGRLNIFDVTKIINIILGKN